MLSKPILLTEAIVFQEYIIVSVASLGREILEQLGIFSGRTIAIQAKAPFSGPYICQVNGIELAIDISLLKYIKVQ